MASNTEKHTNRLIHEKSPYLLVRAHNPVDWYPWGQEAFQKARDENKPIFLSVGYSTCHWCHVMEHESFENDKVAEIMNKYFVNIKVDREENPGVDRFYMTFVQLTTGGGGWPMSVFLTPDLQPFMGATYFPPDDKFGRPGFKTILTRIAQIWVASPEKLKQAGKNTVAQLKAYVESKPPGSSSANALTPWSAAEDTFDHFESSFDEKQGGFGGAPKFPTPVQLLFLLDYYGYQHKPNNARKALDMVLFTLQKIAAGGIHDHVGSGFHRYSTDDHWQVPHFEKMLYDQAQLLMVYSRAYQITKDELYADIVKDIVRYVSRDLLHSEGGFYAAEDADSLPTAESTKKKEGAFCVWEAGELVDILGDDAAAMFAYRYSVKEQGNVDPDQDPHNELEKKNVLFEQHSIKDTAQKFGASEESVSTILQDSLAKLLEYRQTCRPKPHLDDKILTSWNGLMISGLAQAARILEDPSMLELAKGAATFIRNNMYDDNKKTLLRSYREGPSSIDGFLDDYSYMIMGLIDLYQATFDQQWLQWAYDLQLKQNDLFYDNDNGGFFSVKRDDESILVRLKDEQDGAEPSANAVSVANLCILGTLVQDLSLSDMAQKTVQAFESTLAKLAFSMPYFVSSFLLVTTGIKEIIVAGDDKHVERMHTFQHAINRIFVPNKLVVHVILGKVDGVLQEKNTVIQDITNKSADDINGVSVFICENFACGMPIHDLDKVISNLSPSSS
ncbi:spermatogenesis-associated protein 20 [Lichtheimia hyalospora FSU 10163]|nr:spermatogenesis-associated protein 20 [Lichtheimia hyalospora FSU 10163]